MSKLKANSKSIVTTDQVDPLYSSSQTQQLNTYYTSHYGTNIKTSPLYNNHVKLNPMYADML